MEMNTMKTTTESLSNIMDAMFRFGAGVDRNEREMLASALTENVSVDFSPCGVKMRLPFGVVNGSNVLIDFLCGENKTQITSHVITNGRIVDNQSGPAIQVLVDATHISIDDSRRRCRMMNWYDVQALRRDGHFRITRMVIDNIWFEGDPGVLLER